MTQEQLLKDTIDYYSVNPAKRRCAKIGGCYYSPEKANKPSSEGCAIGRHLTPEAKIAFDDLASSDIVSIMNHDDHKAMMPDWMQEMNPDFLNSIQNLHDGPRNWDINGLTGRGKEIVNDIITEYQLNLDRYTI
jgi:hypothetical protein